MQAITAFVSTFITGLTDSVKGVSLFIELIKQNNELRKAFRKSVVLNIFVLAFSILIIEYVIFPLFSLLLSLVSSFLFPDTAKQNIEMVTMVTTLVWYVVNGLWVLPLLWISKIINILTFQKMAVAAYKTTFPVNKQSRSPNHNLNISLTAHISRLLADCIFRMVIELLFMLQSLCISFIPVVGSIVYLLHLSILNALYAFEYKWMHQGIETKAMLRYIQCGWPYFIGYVSILTLATYIPSSFVISACIYSAFFPIYIVSAYPAKVKLSHHAIPQLKIFTLSSMITDRMFVRSARSPTLDRRTAVKEVAQSIPDSSMDTTD
eukprot:TRINITY_DN2950_c0_g1_i4.p1 TRINITY_DN2950_c0_g1~~TRINITY_DN2950_c0_g1_i4.p1  ORF type:complete len:321 (-),score=42.93 TRINITY_DN2950_c0_g1_i4:637-1599(-)